MHQILCIDIVACERPGIAAQPRQLAEDIEVALSSCHVSHAHHAWYTNLTAQLVRPRHGHKSSGHSLEESDHRPDQRLELEGAAIDHLAGHIENDRHIIITTECLAAKTTIRVGHFPNVTHAQGLVAHASWRQGKGWFEKRLGPDVTIQWFVYNAGPSAMEAILAKSIDLAYVGPNPAINAHAKSRGEEASIIAGAANGGSALVVQGNSTLKIPVDFRGKRIASPQLGNTRTVAARSWLVSGGLRITQMGGDAQVVPTANPDQLLLFKQKQLDGVWTVEPWVSLLETEAGGKVLVEGA